MSIRAWLPALLVGFTVATAHGAEALPIGVTFSTKDSLTPEQDNIADAQLCLNGLCWKPGPFQVTVQNAVDGHGDALVRFPSALPQGDQVNDLVALEWYVVRDAEGAIANAPAVIVIHESGRSMPVGRLFARGFRQRGIHAFLLQLPGYGVRRVGKGDIKAEEMLPSLLQGVSDARRALDAVSVLPGVSRDAISLQGTSLGGFVASTAGALDTCYESVFITLAGGDLYSIVKSGKKDAAKVRERLERAGIDDAKLREMTQAIEPNRLAHRLNPETTFVYSGLYDDVVPIDNVRSLVEAAGIPEDHHVCLPADHYTGIVFLPIILDHMAGQMRGEPVHDLPAVP
ncbi:MAG: hypothetical protein KDA90_07055 [Planctomycetaceae bacterium]|nr:hypothetical protein [Planctomycetaceae bacterium]